MEGVLSTEHPERGSTMKCLSYNCKGLASASKKLAMRRLIENEPTDIIMLQETLGNADSIEKTLSNIKPSW